MKTLVLSLAAFLVLSTTACHLPANASTTEQQVYADLVTAQSALNDLKAQEPAYPQIKAPLNAAIAVFNTTEKGFVDFEMAKKMNLSNPADLVTIENELLDLKSSISTIGVAIQGVK